MTERHNMRATQPKDREEDSFDRDLHPNTNAGINHEQLGANPERDAPAGIDKKALHTILQGFTNDELRRIVVLQTGDRLEQGATYIDLATPDRQPFTADADMVVNQHNLIIPKSEVEYQLWNRIIGVDNPERTGDADQR